MVIVISKIFSIFISFVKVKRLCKAKDTKHKKKATKKPIKQAPRILNPSLFISIEKQILEYTSPCDFVKPKFVSYFCKLSSILKLKIFQPGKCSSLCIVLFSLSGINLTYVTIEQQVSYKNFS
jgi:hypothetical protein